MKHLYIGCLVTPEQDNFIYDVAKAAVTVSATTFQRAFLSGYERVKGVDYVVNAPDIGSWPKRCNKIIIPESTEVTWGIDIKNLTYWNITYFKRYSISHAVYNACDKWIAEHQDETIVITVYGLIFCYLEPAIRLKKKYKNVKVSCIVLDLPEYFGDSNSLLSKLTSNTKPTYELVKHIDAFVLLTEQMRAPLKVGNRPWILMEGIYQKRELFEETKVPKSVLYTGKLDGRFGIRILVDNFCKITDPEVQLWICGNGIDRAYVEEKSAVDGRIKYFGQVRQEEVFKLQKKTSLLINPRGVEGEYTKYSFPSKTMEYMASGTPTLMYRLPGMPEEYTDYVALFPDNSDAAFINTLDKWLHKSQVELDAFGERARKFIIENKTSDKQIARYKIFLQENFA